MIDTPPTPPVAAEPAPPSPWLGLFRAVFVAALSLSLSLLGVLALAATLPIVRESLKPLLGAHPVVSVAAIVIILGTVTVVPLILFDRLVRRGWLRWPHLALLAVLVGGAFTYLAWDDPVVRRPLTMDELAPALPGDEATSRLTLRFAKGSRMEKAYLGPRLTFNGVNPAQPVRWAQFLQAHRAEIESGWTQLAPVRAWWDEMAAAPRLGDLTPPRPDAPIPAFQPMRQYCQYAVAIASLQALDGQGDAAAATLLRLYEVARKLEPNSRTLVRTMIARVTQRLAIETAGFVLSHATVSPASRAALAASLAATTGGPAGVRRLVLTEYCFFESNLNNYFAVTVNRKEEDRALRSAGALLGHLVVNPRATQNLVGDRYYQLAGLAEERRFAEFEIASHEVDRDLLGGYRIKNLGGRLFADTAMPAFSRVVKSYWDIEDLRQALLQRLRER